MGRIPKQPPAPQQVANIDGELASINGIKPKILLAEGETRESKSQPSVDKSYTQKRTMDHYYCTCPSWRLAGGAVNARTCRHLLLLLGGAYEEARLETADSDAGATMPGKAEGKKMAAVAPFMEEGGDEDEDEGEGDGDGDEGDGDGDEDEGDGDDFVSAVKENPSRKRKVPASAGDGGGVDEEKKAPAAKRRTSARSKPAASTPSNSLFKPLLAHKWDIETGKDPTGWLMSEKLDGVRAIWHGNKGIFLSREGNPFYAPAWFTKRFPKNEMLDGELFTVRGGFQDCVSIVRTQNRPDRWKFSVSYQVFDVPSMVDTPFEKRLAWLQKKFAGRNAIQWVHVLEHEICESREHLLEKLDDVCEQKGEGVMLRESGSYYVQGRARSLLKVKRFLDADAIVRGHEKGSGKNSNCTGALKVEMLDDNGKPTGKMFKIGTGFTDAQRRSPPNLGSIVIYRYQELSNSGTPRFPSYAGERAD